MNLKIFRSKFCLRNFREFRKKRKNMKNKSLLSLYPWIVRCLFSPLTDNIVSLYFHYWVIYLLNKSLFAVCAMLLDTRTVALIKLKSFCFIELIFNKGQRQWTEQVTKTNATNKSVASPTAIVNGYIYADIY